MLKAINLIFLNRERYTIYKKLKNETKLGIKCKPGRKLMTNPSEQVNYKNTRFT